MAKIKEITAHEILNAKGYPTIETTVILSDGISATASAPSGTSLSSYEAFELHDHDATRFLGHGVKKAIENITDIIAPKLAGMEVTKQQEIDGIMLELDGTQNKARLGANTILSVSMAVAKAAATSSVLPLFLYLREYINLNNAAPKIPIPLFSLINGGKHGIESLNFQEFLVVPASSKSFAECMQIGFQTSVSLQNVLRLNNLPALVGLEGGFGPNVKTNYDALSLLMQAVDTTIFRLGYDVFLGLDAAANTFYKNQEYHISDKASGEGAKNLINYYDELIKAFHLLYLEDPLAEDDWDGWIEASIKLGNEVTITGDDLIATNPYRLQMAIEKKAINGVVIKPNQIGTVIEALAVVEVARVAGNKIIVSGRSGETNDDFIADFAVAVSADYVKFGALQRGEHVAKYNRLLQINERLKLL